MNFKTGDEITIARGTYRNQTATVLEVSGAKEQYAVKLSDGTLTVVNAKNVRVPSEVSISARDLADAFSIYADDFPEELMELLGALEKRAPGITAHVKYESA